MPKLVDHEQRRRQIAEALLRVAAVRGLHQVGLREVAAEAGMSVRLIQYYFGTKEQLLLYATQYLAVALADRAKARITAAGPGAGPRAVIEAILAEALPDDEDSRVFNVIWTSYVALSLTDPALDMGPLARDSNVIIDVIGAQLRSAQDGGRMPPGLDASLEAASLVALSAGLGTSVLVGDRDAAQAWVVIRYQLDRLLPDR
ncbi:MAG TPA: TetR/AcrR family transcriptional regulator [Streptosporangiaceae bacterium]